MSKPLVFAHRGLSAEYAENTLAAFRAAAAAGFDGIELDVRPTHDGVVVVMHDANIARTTDGVGRVGDFDFDELRTHETAEGPIPTLDETLDLLPDWHGQWNIEIKGARATTGVLEAIAARPKLRVMITAMDPSVLEHIHGDNPKIEKGLITVGPPDSYDIDEAVRTGSGWLMVDHEFITAELAEQLAAVGIKMGAWTVNETDDALRVGPICSMVMTDTAEVLAALQ